MDLLSIRELKQEKKSNENIDRMLQRERQKFFSEVTLLLQGPGESGKSTIAKQFKILSQDRFSDDEKWFYKHLIHQNVITAMTSILEAADEFDWELTAVGEESADVILNMKEYFDADLLRRSVLVLLEEEVVQKTIERGPEFQLLDSAEYFFGEIERICEEGFVPTDQDILRARQMTTGVIETRFEIEGLQFKLIDVAGQKNKRKKWIHFFEDVDSILFCASIGDYDMVMREDDTMNRMVDTLELFESVVNDKWFKDTNAILFLNKEDIFKEKIKEKPLTIAFPDYTGSNNPDEALEFISNKFRSVDKNAERLIFHHVTCATSTENMKAVFESVYTMIIHNLLSHHDGVF